MQRREVLGKRTVVERLEGEGAATLSMGAQGREIAEHVGDRSDAADDRDSGTTGGVEHDRPPLLEGLHDGAQVLVRDADLQAAVRLEDDRAGLLERLPEGVARGGVDRDLRLAGVAK